MIHRALISSTAALAVLLAVAPSDADAKKAKYIYIVSAVEPGADVKNAPTEAVKTGLQKGLKEATEIMGALPDDAPDPVKEAAKFKRYLKKKRLRAFKVNLEIIAYEKTAETLERGNQRVGVHINIRLFGETIPDRVMAFAGEGSATVKLDVGKKVRRADERAANEQAIEVAVNDAIAASLKKLAAGKAKKKRRRKK